MSLNLRGAVAGLGRGLVTLGQQGIEDQQRAVADARIAAREQAMAALNHEYRTQEADATATREIGANEVRDDQLLARRKGELAIEEPSRVAADQRATARETARSTTEHAYRMEEMSARERLQFNTWRQQHQITQNDQRSYDLWRQERGIGGEGAERYVQDGESGHYVAIGRDGATRDTGIAFPRRAGADDELGLDDDPPAAAAPAASRPTLSPRRPAAAGNDTPPVAGARRAADGNWYVTRRGQHFRVEP